MSVTAWTDRISRYLHERKGALSKVVAGVILAIFIVGLAGLALLIVHKAFAGDFEPVAQHPVDQTSPVAN